MQRDAYDLGLFGSTIGRKGNIYTLKKILYQVMGQGSQGGVGGEDSFF